MSCKYEPIYGPIFNAIDKNKKEWEYLYWLGTEVYVYLHDGKSYCGSHCEVENVN